MPEIAAIVACVVLAALSIFQISLAAGTPLGRFAWGGQHDVLPSRLRGASIFSVVLYGFFALVALNQAGIITALRPGLAQPLLIAMTVYFFIGIGMNAISRSRPERFVMTPVAAILALTFLIICLRP